MGVRKGRRTARAPWWRLARTSRLGFGLVFAFLLPTLALSYLGIQSVRNEAVARRQLLEDTHQSIRKVVGSGIDARIAEVDRALVREVAADQPDRATLIARVEEAETTQPGLQPLVLLDHGGKVVYPPRGRELVATERPLGAPPIRSEFDTLFSAAEAEEFRAERPVRAVTLYGEALAEATTDEARTRALNAKARSARKANQPGMALDTYEALIAMASPLDAGQARRVLVAHHETIACYEAMADAVGAAQATVDLFRALIELRFIVDEDTHAFYRGKLDEILKRHTFDGDLTAELANLQRREQRQHDTASVLDSLARVGAQLAPAFLVQPQRERGARYVAAPTLGLGVLALALVTGRDQASGDGELVLVRRWHQTDIAPLFEDVLSESGPWNDAGIALLDPAGRLVMGSTDKTPADRALQGTALMNLPGWQVATFPLGGSFEATAASDVRRYTLFLLLVLGTVVAGLALAARSLSKELALSRLRAEFVSSVSLPEPPVLVHADPEAIDQVLINLLSNATKYIRDEERTVTVSLSTEADRAEIRVADTGIGMSPEHVAHIFERYYRADTEPVRAVPGSGIGLTLVRHIMEAHGGEIRVESVPNAGSAFTIILPVLRSEAHS